MEATLDLGLGQPERRRIARACANCRRRKIRCNGSQPCSGCNNAGLECTYDPGKYTSSAAYIASLEKELIRLQRKLGCVRNGITASDSDVTPQLSRTTSDDSTARTQASSSPEQDALTTVVSFHAFHLDSSDEEEHSPERHNRSGFGGLNLLRRLQSLCENAVHGRHDTHSPGKHQSAFALSSALDSGPPEYRPPIPWEAFSMLPSRETIYRAIDHIDGGCIPTLHFVDRETLESAVEEVLEAADHGDVKDHRKPLSLVFAILALSQRFDLVGELDDCSPKSARKKKDEHYFRAARALIDPSDCQDLTSLQCLLAIILYTQSCSMLSVCYSYICMAVAAALQMGLYDVYRQSSISSAEGRRSTAVATVLFILDTTVTVALGLPRTLRDIDLDSMVWNGANRQKSLGVKPETKAYMELARILADIVDGHHPGGKALPHSNGFYTIHYDSIVNTENRLSQWYKELETGQVDVGRLSSDQGYLRQAATQQSASAPRLTLPHRAQLLLRLYHAHVQLVLYRPFLHHALQIPQRDDRLSLKAYACGSACLKASMQVVWLTEKMDDHGVFNPAQWFVGLVIATTAACLVLFATGAKYATAEQDTIEAIERLKRTCARSSRRCGPLRDCLAFLESYFPSHETPVNRELAETYRARFQRNVSQFAGAVQENSQDDMAGEDIRALNLPYLDSFLHSAF